MVEVVETVEGGANDEMVGRVELWSSRSIDDERSR